MKENSRKQPKTVVRPSESNRPTDERFRSELIPLLQLLARQPPPDHDFRTCPICKRYGITKI